MSRSLRLLITLFIVTVASAFATDRAPATALTPPRDHKILILGDSITQDGRYVSFLEYYLHRLTPGAKNDVISIGLGSETVSGLTEPGHSYPRPVALARLGRALALTKPTLVFACYGMNDGIYHPPSAERRAAFAAGLDELIRTVRATGAQLILVTPPVFDPSPIPQRLAPSDSTEFGYGKTYARYDDVLAEFATIGLTRRTDGVAVIDLHTAMATALTARRTTNPTFTFAPDGVHPAELGHLLIAQTIARGLGLTPPAGELEPELARIQADPLFPLVRDRRSLRSESWLALVGYTRGDTFRSQENHAAERVAARLQAEIERLTQP